MDFIQNDVLYGDTNSFSFEIKHWDKIDKAGIVGKI